MKKLDLGAIAVPLDQYASQGNAILGIRGSGKSYTATYIAERLLDASVPIVAFDPIGIWRFLRVRGPTNEPAYKIVVAGGEHGDLPLPAHGAAEIMRAAMRDGVSIVFDLYDIALSKGDWKRVVESVIKVLLYENKAHGLRHVFLEEAAEFCPQRVMPDTASVYSAVERLARMGGNAQLGYTLINQRAEEVNKAVLELCDLLILHRQKGRNSLIALGKWLDVAMAKGKVAEEVPALGNGEAFVWPTGDAPPAKTKIPQKRTFHPDRTAAKTAALVEGRTADVSAFVTKMRGNLEALTKEAQENDPKLLRATIARLERELTKKVPAAAAVDPAAIEDAEMRGHAMGHEAGYARALRALAPTLERMKTLTSGLVESVEGAQADIEKLTRDAPAPKCQSIVSQLTYKPPPRINTDPITSGSVSAPQQRILEALAMLEGLGYARPSREQLALWAKVAPSGGGFRNNLGALRTAGLIDYPGEGIVALTDAGRSRAPTPVITLEDMRGALFARVGASKAAILQVLIEAYPKDLSRHELADAVGLSGAGGGFRNNLGALRTLGVIDYPAPERVVALPVLFLQ